MVLSIINIFSKPLTKFNANTALSGRVNILIYGQYVQTFLTWGLRGSFDIPWSNWISIQTKMVGNYTSLRKRTKENTNSIHECYIEEQPVSNACRYHHTNHSTKCGSNHFPYPIEILHNKC